MIVSPVIPPPIFYIPYPTFNVEDLFNNSSKTYSFYGLLSLLPSQLTSQMESWRNLLRSLEFDEIENVYENTCNRMIVSLNTREAPVPLADVPRHDSATSIKSEPDIVQSPNNTSLDRSDSGYVHKYPTAEDFEDAAWISTKHNGITQYWAPRHTVFSQGNSAEKNRILHIPSVHMAISQGKTRGCTAVDLYAGIGDFAFSYAAAGVQNVLCWDSDPWSIEGLRKGALRNNWKVQVHDNQLHPESTDFRISSKTKLVAFVESNEKALERIQILRDALPPIRHVNCGLLPTSRDCYATAAAALDPELGGWVHVHESFGVQEVTCKAKKIRVEFEELIKNLDKERGFSKETTARKPVVEHIQRVKTYGPGVLHCVVDIFVPPIHR